jgi:3-oxoacyl-(acyl-carrier-protein) synthase III
MLRVRIAGTSALAAGPAVSTAELVSRLSAGRDRDAVVKRTGIVSRRLALAGMQAAELGARALRVALAAADLAADALARLIFVDSLGGDMHIPPTANAVATSAGIAGTCDCFDLNNACMGFLTALDLGARSIATGSGPVGIVVVEMGSRYITPEEPRPFLVLGDGVAAVILDQARGEEGILASYLRNDGTCDGGVRLANGNLTGRVETIRFGESNATMGRLALDAIRRSTESVLRECGLDLAAIDWVLPHQPNGSLLDQIVDALGIDPTRVVRVVHEVGSVGAASIPISLDTLLRSGRARSGDRVLMTGVGAGLSLGAMLIQLP